jgi:predicted nucleic acid-binding protein
VARYVGRGLPAHRAAYPALAAGLDLRLHTLDAELARVAGALAATP